jgi:hypothetical protein
LSGKLQKVRNVPGTRYNPQIRRTFSTTREGVKYGITNFSFGIPLVRSLLNMSLVEYCETSLVHGVRLPFLRYLRMVLNYLHMGTWDRGMRGEKLSYE